MRPIDCIQRAAAAAGLFAVVVIAPACAGATGGASTEAMGPWTLMLFRGGPPEPGQLTDTLEVDIDARRVKLTREKTGDPTPYVCDGVLDGGALDRLAEALRAGDLRDALEHPDRIPSLAIDMGYFQASRGGVTIAVSDAFGKDGSDEAEALREVGSQFTWLAM